MWHCISIERMWLIQWEGDKEIPLKIYSLPPSFQQNTFQIIQRFKLTVATAKLVGENGD